MNILVIDDDKAFCEQLKNDFIQYFKSDNLDLKFEIFYQSDFDLTQTPDILFIDIDLSKNDSGIDVAIQLRKLYPNLVIIFTSVREDLVFNTLITGVFQFIRKQKYESDLKITLIQLSKYFEKNFQKVVLDIHGKKELIYFKDVQYIMAIGRSLLIYANKEYEINGTILDATHLFPAYNFVQIQRGLIINLSYITNVSYNHVEMFDHHVYKVGRKYQEELKKIYKEYLLKC